MKTLITGVAGAGKTTIAAELVRRGYDGRNMDYIPGLCSWVDLGTGIADPNFKIESASDWVNKYDWLWNDDVLTRLLNENGDTYFCGSSGNQEKYYRLFGRIFLLEMNEELIKDRVLNSERDHDYGRKPGEIEAILGYYERFQDHAKAAGAIVIDASMPIGHIVDLVLSDAR